MRHVSLALLTAPKQRRHYECENEVTEAGVFWPEPSSPSDSFSGSQTLLVISSSASSPVYNHAYVSIEEIIQFHVARSQLYGSSSSAAVAMLVASLPPNTACLKQLWFTVQHVALHAAAIIYTAMYKLTRISLPVLVFRRSRLANLSCWADSRF